MWKRAKRSVQRVGWIIGPQLTESRLYYRIDVRYGGPPLARFSWVADAVNGNKEYGLNYEVYRPWRRYDALIFLKSMGAKSMRLISRYRDRGRVSIFDANVNYYESEGTEYYQGMLPTARQTKDAIDITTAADAVIADSKFIAQQCSRYNRNVAWAPDAVRMDAIPPYQPSNVHRARLPVLWSGEAVKLFELLAIEKTLERYANHIELILVTNSLDALGRWRLEYKEKFKALMGKLNHQIVPYTSIHQLFDVYSRGGVFISPRFLDNTYNMGHTEWKIALAMACGRIAFCSPVPSYEIVCERAKNEGIRICRETDEWDAAFDSLLAGRVDVETEERAAKSVIDTYYSSDVVAREHAGFVRAVLS